MLGYFLDCDPWCSGNLIYTWYSALLVRCMWQTTHHMVLVMVGPQICCVCFRSPRPHKEFGSVESFITLLNIFEWWPIDGLGSLSSQETNKIHLYLLVDSKSWCQMTFYHSYPLRFLCYNSYVPNTSLCIFPIFFESSVFSIIFLRFPPFLNFSSSVPNRPQPLSFLVYVNAEVLFKMYRSILISILIFSREQRQELLSS